LLLVLVLAGFVGLVVGPSALGPSDILRVLRGADPGSAAADIVLRVRLPRVQLGMLVGASLAVSGCCFKRSFETRWPIPSCLASPGVRHSVPFSS